MARKEERKKEKLPVTAIRAPAAGFTAVSQKVSEKVSQT
jgi:hypothetical protein